MLGAINGPYELLCDVRMYVCMCLKGSVSYGQTVGVLYFFLLHKTEWVYMAQWILILEGQQNCMIRSKVTTISPLFFFIKKNFKHRHVGCLSQPLTRGLLQ